MSRASDLANLIASGNTTIFGEAGVTSSGSTGKTTNLQQGLAKSWANLNGTGTISLDGSFNVTTATDVGTGVYTFNFTNNMSNTESSFTGTSEGRNGASTGVFTVHSSGSTSADNRILTTSVETAIVRPDNNAVVDRTPVCMQVLGDLA